MSPRPRLPPEGHSSRAKAIRIAITSTVAKEEAVHADSLSSRNIPSLDGLRALSVLLVIVSHSSWYLPAAFSGSLAFRMVVGTGAHGVAVFFVISGYLITTLLLREFRKTGTVSLRRFYLRRTLRIFPPFYAFLVVMAVLWGVQVIPEHLSSFVAAATYTWALSPGADGYFIGHSWSLSIEELFYLFWPLLFLLGHLRKKILNIALFLIIVMPIVRVALYFIAPFLRGHEGYMVQGWIDTMMVGCMLALLKGLPAWEEWHRRYLNAWSAWAMAFTAFFLVPYVHSFLARKVGGLFNLSTNPTVTALCIGGILVYVVEHADTVLGRVLNNRAVRHIGVLSYSLYLWQQLFMSHELHLLPYGYLYALAAAELSFWLVEKPSLALRTRLERKSEMKLRCMPTCSAT